MIVTDQERQQAALIILKLRTYYSRKMVAEMIGIDKYYVSFAQRLTKRSYDDNYICPAKAIRQILDFLIDQV